MSSRNGKSLLVPGTILAIVLVLVLPLLNSFGLVSDYYLNLFGKYLSLAILALGMDLIWGYTGILSLGQAIFFGFGAYAMGMHMMLQSGGRGVYGEPIPDFMVTALCVVGSFLFCRWLVNAKMGLVLTAIRDQEQRLQFLGYPVARYKIFIFAVAAALAGLAGALYAPQVGIITPSQIGVLPSLEVVCGWRPAVAEHSLVRCWAPSASTPPAAC